MSLRDKLVVLNAGSSSLKFQIFEFINGERLATVCSGLLERIGDPSRSRMKVVSQLGALRLCCFWHDNASLG